MHYIDTSALAKLVVVEAESEALHEWVTTTAGGMVTSDLARIELLRAVRRVAPVAAAAARDVLSRVTLLDVTSAVLETAALLDPPALRSLDAVHLASALQLSTELDGFVTYDDRLADAARLVGLDVIAPGQP